MINYYCLEKPFQMVHCASKEVPILIKSYIHFNACGREQFMRAQSQLTQAQILPAPRLPPTPKAKRGLSHSETQDCQGLQDELLWAPWSWRASQPVKAAMLRRSHVLDMRYTPRFLEERLLWTECLCPPPPPQAHGLKSDPQCDGIRTGALGGDEDA